jgi:branched-chain amino acid transport system permease protein
MTFKAIGPARAAVFFVALASLPFLGVQHWVLNMLVFTLMYAVMSSAWNLVGGMAGYPSLGHAAFFGIGAYAEAIWFQHHQVVSGFEPLYLLPLVAIVGGLIGYPFALVAMRTRADVFAIVTITLLFVGQTLAFNLTSLTEGAQGMSITPAPFAAAVFERPYYFVLLVLLALAMGLTWATMRSKVGLSLAAVRADEDKAAGLGVHVNGVKMLAFCVSVGITAMVGAVWAAYESFIYPQFAFDPLITIGIVLMTFLGGRGTLWGPVLGAFILELAQQYLAYSLGGNQYYLIAYALVFLIVMLVMPRGVLPTVQDRLRARRRRAAAASSGPASSGPASVGPLPPASRSAAGYATSGSTTEGVQR